VNYGLVFTGFGVAAVLGPIVGAAIRDRFGSYVWAFGISGVMLLIGALLAFTLKTPIARPLSPVRAPAPAPTGGGR